MSKFGNDLEKAALFYSVFKAIETKQVWVIIGKNGKKKFTCALQEEKTITKTEDEFDKHYRGDAPSTTMVINWFTDFVVI